MIFFDEVEDEDDAEGPVTRLPLFFLTRLSSISSLNFLIFSVFPQLGSFILWVLDAVVAYDAG